MNILIVIPKYWPMPFAYYDFPVGLAYISAVLKRAGHTVDILNLNEYYGRPQLNDWSALRMLIERAFTRRSYDILCTGGISAFYDIIKAIVEQSKVLKPQITAVIGGGLVSSEPKLILENIDVDFGVIGEGEETIVELVSEIAGQRQFNNIKGIIYRDSLKNIVQTTARPAIDDINSLPFPDYEGFDLETYLKQIPSDLHGEFKRDHPRALPILASRSCPFKCSFCFHPVGNKYRQRSIDSVFSEIDILVSRYKINTLVILDELFGFNREYLLEFCRRIKQYSLDFIVQLHVSQVNSETIRLLKDAGCLYISYGIESASNVVLKSMRKHSTVAQIENALELTYNAHIQIQGNFIFGDAGETSETVAETFAWWHKNRKYMINLSKVMAYPGSELWDRATEKGIITNKIDYIVHQCGRLFPLNVSQLSGADANKLMRTIEHTDFYFRMPGKVLSCAVERFDYKKRTIYSLKVQCPHCSKVGFYPTLHCKHIDDVMPPFTVNRIGCRSCNHRFDILPYKVEAALAKILQYKSGSHIVLLCADDRSANLLRFSLSLRERVTCVADDLARSGLKEIEGVKVVSLSNNLEEIASLADTLVITSDHAKRTHANNIIALQNLGLTVFEIRELSLPDFSEEHKAVAFVKAIMETAGKAMDNHQPAYAFASVLSVVDKFPSFRDAHLVLANAALVMGDAAVAMDALHTVQLLNPADTEVMTKLSELYLSRNEYSLARRQLEMILSTDPGNFTAFSSLIKVTLHLGDMPRLVDYLNRFSPHQQRTSSFNTLINQVFYDMRQVPASNSLNSNVVQNAIEIKGLAAATAAR